jgi:hypothetical protein
LESESLDAVVKRLWRGRLPGAPAARRRLLGRAMPKASELDRSVLDAVRLHLCSLVALEEGDLRNAISGVSETLAAWQGVEQAIGNAAPEMAQRAHAFHARLASRHQAAFSAIARKTLADLAHGAMCKTESIHAAALAAEGDERGAAEALEKIAARWRHGIPIRLPGLRAIELTAARWFEAADCPSLAKPIRDSALTISGRRAAYPEESPKVWPPILYQEDLLRFAFAASRLPAVITAAETIENGMEQP